MDGACDLYVYRSMEGVYTCMVASHRRSEPKEPGGPPVYEPLDHKWAGRTFVGTPDARDMLSWIDENCYDLAYPNFLIPNLLKGYPKCEECEGSGWTMMPNAQGRPVETDCAECHGYGHLEPQEEGEDYGF